MLCTRLRLRALLSASILLALGAEGGAGAQTSAAAPAGAAPSSAATPAPVYLIPGQPRPPMPGAATSPARPKPRHEARGGAGASHDGVIVTLPGFRMLDGGGSQIYVELSASVAVEEHRMPSGITYKLKGARVPLRNNRNALVTTHFNTPVARTRLVPAGRDVDLVVTLRAASQPQQRIVAGEGGTSRVEVDFPAGNFAPAAPTSAVEPSADADSTAAAGDEPAATPPPRPLRGTGPTGRGSRAPVGPPVP